MSSNPDGECNDHSHVKSDNDQVKSDNDHVKNDNDHVKSDNDHVKINNDGCKKKSELLKSMRETVKWEIEKERRKFLCKLYLLVSQWKSKLPDLRDTFRREEIDWLILQDLKNSTMKFKFSNKANPIIDFVIKTGYQDEPELDEDGKPRLRRTTAIHHVSTGRFPDKIIVLSKLFKIYNRFDVNYIDKFGRTHFHVACEFGFYSVVAKFLKLGQDPNCLPQKSETESLMDPPLNLALAKNGRLNVVMLLLKSGADPTLVNKDGLTPLHVICQRDEMNHDLAKVFFRINRDKQQLVPINAQDNLGNTPLHSVLAHDKIKLAKWLLKYRADPNLANAEGLTALHIIVTKYEDRRDLEQIFFQFCDEQNQSVLIDARDKFGNTPLLLALGRGNIMMAECLLRRGADPNLANNQGFTSLHVISEIDKDVNYVELAKLLFKLTDELHRPLQIDARDRLGRTPLYLALELYLGDTAEFLLRKGADPNLADNKGSTPLHLLCKMSDSVPLAEMLLKVSDELHLQLQVNARDNSGNTPLHLALDNYHLSVTAELLLKRGADPNLANNVGSTSLHIICEGNEGHYLAFMLFDIMDEKRQQVQIGSVDKWGQTPLQIAVKNFFPKIVEILLDRGADLSSFVFPTNNLFNGYDLNDVEKQDMDMRFVIISHMLEVLECLEKRGYELNRRGALAIVKFYTENRAFKDLMSLDSNWRRDKEFVIKAKKFMINSAVSLYDFIRLRPEELKKPVTITRCVDIVFGVRWHKLSIESQKVWLKYLCDKMWQGFYRRWGLKFFMELTGDQLPKCCYEKIIDQLMGKDLFRICLATDITAKE